jgi:hypothetical protein
MFARACLGTCSVFSRKRRKGACFLTEADVLADGRRVVVIVGTSKELAELFHGVEAPDIVVVVEVRLV